MALAAARAELATIAEQLPREPGDSARSRTIQLFPYSGTAAGDSLVAQRGPWFLALFSIITALTLLIVCANVANLMLARGRACTRDGGAAIVRCVARADHPDPARLHRRSLVRGTCRRRSTNRTPLKPQAPSPKPQAPSPD